MGKFRGFGDYPYCQVGIGSSIPRRTNCKRTWNGPRIPLPVSQPNQSTGVSRARFACEVGKIGLIYAVSFHGHSHRRVTTKHIYIQCSEAVLLVNVTLNEQALKYSSSSRNARDCMVLISVLDLILYTDCTQSYQHIWSF